MKKISRSRSSDPAHENLRGHKDIFNKQVSAFINDLIHLKKLMNGWDNKFYKEKSKIIHPIPADPATIIGSLAGDFQDIAQYANQIVQYQIEYANKRRQKQQPQQLSLPLEADLHYDLLAEGSNSLSRFWSKIISPPFGFGEKAKLRRVRVTLLNGITDIDKNLKKYQNKVISSSNESIKEAHKLFQDTKKKFDGLYLLFKQFKPNVEALPESTTETSKSTEKSDEKDNEITKEDKKIKNMAKDVIDNYSYFNFYEYEYIDEIYEMAKSIILLDKIDPNFEQKYHEVVKRVAEDTLKDEMNSNIKSFADIVKWLKNKKKTILEGIRKNNQQTFALYSLSQFFLTKWLNRFQHEFGSNETSSYRLTCYKIAEYNRDLLDQIMDLLEKTISPELDSKFKELNQKMVELQRFDMALYNIFYNKGK